MTKGEESTKGEEGGVQGLDAEEALAEARPLLLRALVKCGHIPTHPPRDPRASTADYVLGLLKEKPHEDYQYFEQLAHSEAATWRELRQKIDVVAHKLASLAKRHRIDPLVALRAAFLMRIGVDHPLGPIDVAAVVDLAALVSRLGDLEPAADAAKPTANGTSSAEAVFASSTLDPLDLRIVEVAMEERGWIKTSLLRQRVKPWKFGVGSPDDKDHEAFRKRVARLISPRGFLGRNCPQGKMVKWTGKQP